jgi:hypothetical protein
MRARLARLDPRLYQIGILACLLCWGVFGLRFDVKPDHALAIVAVALGTQYVAGRVVGLPAFDPKSALISALSLCLLLRTGSLALAALAAFLAIAMKFVVRVRGKHVFNPTNGAIVVLLLSGAPVWVSPGQWGNAAFFGFLMACLGGLVVNRAARSDVVYAFAFAWCAILFGRSLLLGEPMTIPFHRLESGALLLFTFFMISDPKTTPDSRVGRIAFAALVAVGAWYVQFKMFRTNGLLWSLFLASPLVPLIDRLAKGVRYDWKRPVAVAAVVAALLVPARADAFCGFFVGKADTKLFNKSSKVVLVRDEDKTVLTMVNDYQGSLKEFAMVIPVPTAITREQIHVGDAKIVDHLDAYTAPRLVEYHDDDPCARRYEEEKMMKSAAPMAEARGGGMRARADALGVKIEAEYTVGEYDILILSAKQSGGLVQWLKQEGYKIPDGAEGVVGSYLAQNMKFFVAKVNLKEHDKLGGGYLRPLQIAYESPKFMLPIRLGTVNAQGSQDLFVFALTRTGRVEATNYRTVKLPSDVEIPEYVKDEFAGFYKDLFATAVAKNDGRAVFTEYAWDMNWCDPCAADPLTPQELRQLGVFWQGDDGPAARGRRGGGGGASDVFVTRLHVRYDGARFPEDLVFQSTQDRTNFQGRYVMRHPWKGDATCPAADAYQQQVFERQKQEARTLVELTGWNLADVEKKMGLNGKKGGGKWYERIWR